MNPTETDWCSSANYQWVDSTLPRHVTVLPVLQLSRPNGLVWDPVPSAGKFLVCAFWSWFWFGHYHSSLCQSRTSCNGFHLMCSHVLLQRFDTDDDILPQDLECQTTGNCIVVLTVNELWSFYRCIMPLVVNWCIITKISDSPRPKMYFSAAGFCFFPRHSAACQICMLNMLSVDAQQSMF